MHVPFQGILLPSVSSIYYLHCYGQYFNHNLMTIGYISSNTVHPSPPPRSSAHQTEVGMNSSSNLDVANVDRASFFVPDTRDVGWILVLHR